MKATFDKILDRIDRSYREATVILEAERKARTSKTERLRGLRLAQSTEKHSRERGMEEDPMTNRKRVVFNSSLTKDGWMVTTSGGEPLSNHETQKESEAAAIAAARQVYKDGGLGQAVLHKANGMIREERTYGKDPERTPG